MNDPIAIADGLADQQAASDPEASVWVSANAGSGKTRVLTNRLIRLMLEGTPPAQLLCLTFTKAAAAEMANRLHETLARWVTIDEHELVQALFALSGEEPDAARIEHSRQLFAKVLESPGGLKVQTIHAFCESLLQRFPLEAGLSPHFDVMDDHTAAEVLRQARDELLTASTDDRAIEQPLRRIIGRVNDGTFSELMRGFAAKRSQVDQLLAEHGNSDGIISAIYERLDLPRGRDQAAAVSDFCRDTEGELDRLKQAIQLLSTGSDAEQTRAEVMGAFAEAGPSRPERIDGYMSVFLTDKGEPRKKLINKGTSSRDPSVQEFLDGEQQRVLRLHEAQRAIRVAEETAALLTLGIRFIDDYERCKRRRGLMDYDDLILRTRDLLRRPAVAPWVQYKLDGGLDHILVDESQDTSPEQWDIITALAKEFFAGDSSRETNRTVFVVGDEKQSIYSFQGADPERFALIREHFTTAVRAADREWRPVDLRFSYRSTDQVLEILDHIFAKPDASDGVAATDEPVRHFPWRRQSVGLVELWPVVEPLADPEPNPWDAPLDQLSIASPEARMAQRIADQVADWLSSSTALPSTGARPRPGDIMILVRRRTSFAEELIRQFKARGVPVAGTDRMVLTEQMAVMDLMSLGKFVLLPEDDLSLAEVLKSPLYNFDDDMLFALAYDRPGTLWQALRDRRESSTEATFACEELESLLTAADFTPPFEFFANLLAARKGRKRIIRRLGQDAQDPIDEFLNAALAFEQSHVPSMQGFLHWLAASSAEIKRDMEQGRDEVRVMTVHGSKGLEAPIVILPDTCTGPSSSHDPKILSVPSHRDGTDLLLWSGPMKEDDPVRKAARQAARDAGMREYRRLFYVAFSRARDRIYVGGWQGKNGRSDGCWYNMIEPVMRHVGREVVLPFGEAGWRFGPDEGAAAEQHVDDDTGPSRDAALPSWAVQTAPSEPIPPRPLAPSRQFDDDMPVQSPLGNDGGQRFRRGLLTHRLLETLPEVAADRRRQVADGWLRRRAAELTPSQREEIVDDVVGVLERSELQPLFAAGSRSEVRLSGVIGEQVVSGQIDRLCIGEDWVGVVDYKTNRPAPMSPEDVPKPYILQMAYYRALLTEIYPDKDIKCWLLWTDGARLMALPDAILKRALADSDP